MSLLSTKPTLQQVCQAILGHAITGDSLSACFANGGVLSYFDGSYVGNKDRLSNFGMYGNAEVSLSVNARNWNYNQTFAQNFTVYCNHSTWKFTSSSDATGFTVAVYDSTNTTYLGGLSGIYPSGCVVRVGPDAQNSGSSDKVCLLYCGTYNGYNVSGGEFTGTQVWNQPPPIVDVECVDETMTLAGIDSLLNIGDTDLWLQFIPDNQDPVPPPKVGNTIYIDVQRAGPIGIASTSITHCFNGVTKTLWIHLNEAALGNTYYYVILSTSNA